MTTQTYKAVPCGCKYAACTDWHVSPVADVQSVCFTQQQAEAVAELLNEMERNRARRPARKKK